MKKFRFASIAAAAVIAVGACAMFAGCTSSSPEVTITYEFNGEEYAVRYKLSRSDAPKTVQHFIELADAGYYDGTCIHDYDSNFLYGGGYYFNEENELTEKNYFEEVLKLEKEGHTFTQTVFAADEARTPLYTVYGEFSDNGVKTEGARQNTHSKGALVMYYEEMGDAANRIDVSVDRNDGGKDNDGEKEQLVDYATNAATSLFYTFMGSSNATRDASYAVFGRTMDFSGELQPLLDAIAEYTDTLVDDEATQDDETSFTRDTPMIVNTLDHAADAFGDLSDLFEGVRTSNIEVTYKTPHDMPITVVSVRVNKY